MTTEIHALKLAAELTLRQAGDTCSALRAAFAEHSDIEIDGTEVFEIDISHVQLLVAAFKSATNAGKNLSVAFRAGSTLDRELQRAGFITREGDPLTPECRFFVRPPANQEQSA